MDSKEILHQYAIGAIKSADALHELEKLQSDTSSFQKLREASMARKVAGFLCRYNQFNAGIASERDLCLNIRDIVLTLGRIKLNERIYKVVRDFGAPFDLICEDDFTVSCLLKTPEWLVPDNYIRDVYEMRVNNSDFVYSYSAGDKNLRDCTIFNEYKSFEQKTAVQTAINLPVGQTLLISQPTGGGKSLVTQMLASTSSGLTLVIVPTVALALDQYYAANRNLRSNEGIFCYRGEQTAEERSAIIKAVKNKTAHILFSSPEAIFKNLELYRLLDQSATDQYLNNVVIDEAHVVPDWGVFFRPDFQIFSIVLKKWRKLSDGSLRTFLLSATLSDDVVETLFALFGSEKGNVQVRCDALRQEPRFYFYSTKSKKEQDNKTSEAIRLLPKPMVVYVLEPREAKGLQKQLKNEGYHNIPVFTGETKESERDKVLNGWKNNEYDVVIATSAFGIGVDKPNVRTIIHACCPENLSRYYQEVGRGGRDGLPSISLFMPYQSKTDKNADVQRALGLVNKRVLTVEKAVIRWSSMLSNPNAMVDYDNCILDTSTAPYSMSEDEAEYAGNMNVAWNINLLLFLHRIGYIDLTDASYIPEKKAYSVKVKLIRTDILANQELLSKELQEPRKSEYDSQMSGYYAIRDLVQSPKSKCWGRAFKKLFPLAKEVCNGCPCDPKGRITTDSIFKLRAPISISLDTSIPSIKLRRNMGQFSEMVVRRNNKGPLTKEELQMVSNAASDNALGCMVIPNRLIKSIQFDGTLLTYEEFYFAVQNTPYMFSKGLLCAFESDINANSTLYRHINSLETKGYKVVLFCNENEVITSNGRTLKNALDGYAISLDRF